MPLFVALFVFCLVGHLCTQSLLVVSRGGSHHSFHWKVIEPESLVKLALAKFSLFPFPGTLGEGKQRDPEDDADLRLIPEQMLLKFDTKFLWHVVNCISCKFF